MHGILLSNAIGPISFRSFFLRQITKRIQADVKFLERWNSLREKETKAGSLYMHVSQYSDSSEHDRRLRRDVSAKHEIAKRRFRLYHYITKKLIEQKAEKTYNLMLASIFV